MEKQTTTTTSASGPEPIHKTATPPTASDAEKGNADNTRPRTPESTRSGDAGPEDEDERYNRFTTRRKHVITAVLSLSGFLAPMSSTAILSAVPEVAAEFNTTGSIINVSNSLFLVGMAASPLFSGPLSQLYGRRIVLITCSVIFFAMSVLTARAPNLPVFFFARIVSALQGNAFTVVGSSCISDIYKPTERATAVGWFLSGTNIAPAVGPFLGGVIVTYATWREIFWLQTGLSGIATILVFWLLPETFANPIIATVKGKGTKAHLGLVAWTVNPVHLFRVMYRYPAVLIAGLASAATHWNLFAMLTPIRYVVNPRFNLSTPLQSGLVFLVPGVGNFLGTFIGGRWADWYVRRYMVKRGRRVPEDRLRSGVLCLGAVMPGALLIYGWTIDQEVGGMAVPLIAMFAIGLFQMITIPCLNTYCLDVLQPQGKSAEAVGCAYLLRFSAGAAASAVILPLIKAIGLGWSCVPTSGLLVLSALGTVWCIRSGESWRAGQEEQGEQGPG